MSKKPAYDVSKRFQEVAKRAKETGPIHTGPSKPIAKPVSAKGPNSGKDVNLPISTASSEVKDRMAKEESSFRDSTATKYKSQSAVVNKESARQAKDINDRMAKLRAMRKK